MAFVPLRLDRSKTKDVDIAVLYPAAVFGPDTSAERVILKARPYRSRRLLGRVSPSRCPFDATSWSVRSRAAPIERSECPGLP